MKHSQLVSWKIMIRTLKLSIPYLLLIVASNALAAYLNNFSVYLSDFTSKIMNLGMVGFLFFTFIGYEYFLLTTNPINAETLIPIPGAMKRLLISQLIVLITLLLLWCVIPFGWLMWAAADKGISYSVFNLHCVLNIALNCFLPGVIGILLSFILALKVNRATAYCIMLVSALLCSPVATQLFASEAIAGISILDVLDWFSILAPNLNWAADAIYGVSIEVCRWVLALLWITAFTAALVWMLNQKRQRYAAFALAVLSLSLGVRFAMRGNDSVVRKDYRSDSSTQHEWTYRKDNPVGPAQTANFTVDGYELVFNVNSKLEATAIVTVAESEQSEYLFTLYHNFTIHRITDENGTELSYTANGDYLTIQTPNGAKELRFEYSGNAGKYFSNYQGIALPGYVPFYPMAGHIPFWNDVTNNVIANTDFPTTKFKVIVNSPLDVMCNLTETSHNSFEGVAGTVSLYGGMMVETETGGLTYYCSPLGSQSLNMSGYKEIWAELCTLTGADIAFDLTGKTIFQQPLTILASGGNESVVVFDDHIIVGNIAPDAEQVCYSHFISMIPDHEDTVILKSMFEANLGSDGNIGEGKPAWSELDILTSYSRISQIEDEEDFFAYSYAESVAFYNLYQYQLATLGRETVMRAVYEYLMSDEHSVNQIEFLYNLGG